MFDPLQKIYAGGKVGGQRPIPFQYSERYAPVREKLESIVNAA